MPAQSVSRRQKQGQHGTVPREGSTVSPFRISPRGLQCPVDETKGIPHSHNCWSARHRSRMPGCARSAESRARLRRARGAKSTREGSAGRASRGRTKKGHVADWRVSVPAGSAEKPGEPDQVTRDEQKESHHENLVHAIALDGNSKRRASPEEQEEGGEENGLEPEDGSRHQVPQGAEWQCPRHWVPAYQGTSVAGEFVVCGAGRRSRYNAGRRRNLCSRLQ